MFLPNSHSFLLVKSKKPVIQSDIQESGIILSSSFSSDSRRNLFLPNSHSFLLVKSKKPVIQSDIQESGIILSSSFSSDSRRNLFLPNSHSFLLVKSKKPVIQSDIQESGIILPSSSSSDPGKPTIGDKDKRTFLKVAGIAGASLVGSLLLPKKAEALIMGSSPTTGVVGVKNLTNERINPATEETLDEVLKKTDLAFDNGSLQVKVTSVSGEGSSSFSDGNSTPTMALVDAQRHVQVDVLSSALPSTASKDETLQTIAYGGVLFALRLATVGDIDYVGEAAIGTLDSDDDWRIKRIDSSSGIIIQWADGDAGFNNVWDNGAGTDYTDLDYL